LEGLDNPYSERIDDFCVNKTLERELMYMERKIRFVLSSASNDRINKYADSIFEPLGSQCVYMRKVCDVILECLEAEAVGANAALRVQEKLPPYTLETDIDAFYDSLLEGLSRWERVCWRLEYTEWWGVRRFLLRAPMKFRICISWCRLEMLRLNLWVRGYL